MDYQILESCPDCMVIVDIKGNINWMNQLGLNMFGYSLDEIKGKVIEILLPKRFRKGHVALRNGYLKCPVLRPIDTRRDLLGARKNGEEFNVSISLSPMKLDGIPVILAAVRDITEIRDQEKKVAMGLDQLSQVNLTNTIESSNAKVELIGQLPKIKAYKTQIALLFQNLISNALKFRKIDRYCEVKISAVSVERGWSFTVEDNGIGISKENFERVFGMFQRLHTQKEFPGSGIGLANCKKIVSLYFGEIHIESKLGEGSKFIFCIPDQDKRPCSMWSKS